MSLDEHGDFSGWEEPEQSGNGDWATFNVNGFYDYPKKVNETISFLLCLRIALWNAEQGEVIELIINPLILTDTIEGKFKKSSETKMSSKNLLAKIGFDDLERCLCEMMTFFQPYYDYCETGFIYMHIKKVGDNFEIYGSDGELQLLGNTSYKSKIIIRGLREAIAEVLKKKRKL